MFAKWYPDVSKLNCQRRVAVSAFDVPCDAHELGIFYSALD
jgi:hypothetical protein